MSNLLIILGLIAVALIAPLIPIVIINPDQFDDVIPEMIERKRRKK